MPSEVGGNHPILFRPQVEDKVRGTHADTRAELRREKSSAIVASLFDLWEKELAKVSGKSKTAEAIRYALRPYRNRLQHRRTRDQAPNNYEKEQSVRRK